MNFDEHRPGRFCRATFRWIVLVGLMLLAAGACDDHRGGAFEQSLRQRAGGAGEVRIVSLSPAVSRTLVDLGLGEQIIGRTPFCRSVNEDVAIVGDLLSVDHERLVRLEPTHVLVQPPAAGPDPKLLALAAKRGWAIATWHLNNLRDIEQMVRDIVELMPGDAVQIEGESLLRELAGIRSMTHDSGWTGRVLIVDSIDPVLAFGTGTYLGEILGYLGCENAMQRDGWVQLSMEDMVRLSPDAIVVVDADATAAERSRARLVTLNIEAVVEGRIAVLEHPDALLPCSAIVEVAAELRSLINGFGEVKDS